MILLLGIGFAAGVVTAISPCVLPVLPIILAGSATGGSRRPFAIISGLVASFTVFTLFAAWLLDQLGLPANTLRNTAIVLLFVVAAALLVPRFGELLERPFLPLTRRRGGDLGGGFLLGASLGIVFVPCAGPVLATISVIAADQDVGWRVFALMLVYALGAAVPMLAIAIGGQRASVRIRANAHRLRVGAGAAIAATALALSFHVEDHLRDVPGYTNFLQNKIERSASANRELAMLRGEDAKAAPPVTSDLIDFGLAPEFTKISRWFNTPGGRPLTMRELRGKVVLIDFWTYTCINCLRTLPHLKAWDAAYRSKGLVIVGVHSPEFAFEHSAKNVAAAIERLGIRYAVPLDNDFGTWRAYSNQYWPAEYLIDRSGHVRHAHFGEGEYDTTETLIRTLLADKGPRAREVGDATPRDLITPESYLGYNRLARYAGSEIAQDRLAAYTLPSTLPRDALAYGGEWRVEDERIVAGRAARLQLHFHARNVFLVLSGSGTVEVLVDGKSGRTIRVGANRLYTLRTANRIEDGVLELRFSPGVAAYAFTFG